MIFLDYNPICALLSHYKSSFATHKVSWPPFQHFLSSPTGIAANVSTATMDSEEEGRRDIREQVMNETLSGLSKEDGAESADACCVICLSAITEACTARPCSHHNFDFLCLASWLQLKPTCPLCKSEVTEIRYDFVEGGQVWKSYKVPTIGLKPDRAGQDSNAPLATNSSLRSRRGASYRSRVPRAANLSAPPSDADERARCAVARRRHVYRNRLYSLHVGSNPASRYREVTPAHFQTDNELLSRARAWARRELQVFEFLSDDHETPGMVGTSSSEGRRRRQNNAEFVLEYIIAILKTVDILASNGHAENLLSDFLGRENCRIFLHELRNFVRSPYSVEVWDRHVQYGESRTDPMLRSEMGANDGQSDSQAGVNGPDGHRYRPSAQDRRSWYRRGRGRRQPGRGAARTGDRWRPD